MDPDLIAKFAGDIDPKKLTFDQAIVLFEKVYMASRNLAARTRVEYRNDLDQLADFLAALRIKTPARVSLTHLQAFQALLDEKGNAGVTRRRKTSSIKAFFSFLDQANLLKTNPAARLTIPYREYKEPRYLTSKEYQALLRACSHQSRERGVDPVTWTPLCLQKGVHNAENTPAVSGRVPGENG